MALLFGVALLNYLDRYVLGILLPAIKTDLHLNDTQLGFITGVGFAVFYAVTGIPIGHLADRHPRRMVIAASVALWSTMTAACGFAQNFVHLVLARIMLGIGEAGATPPSHSLISDIFPARERAFALSIFSMGLPAGILVGFLGGGYIAGEFGWRIALVVFGLPGLILAVLVATFLPEPLRGAADVPGNVLARVRPVREVCAILAGRPSFLHVCLGSGFFTVVWLGFITWLPSYFTRAFQLSMAEAGAGLAVVLGTSQAIGLGAGGWMADRLGRRDVRWPFWTCALGALLPLPCFAVALLHSNPVVAMLMLFPAFLLGMLQGAPAVAIVQMVAGRSMRAVTVAIYLVVVNLISGLGAQLIGLLSDRIPGSAGSALGVAMLLVAVVFSLWSAFHFWRGARFLAADSEAAASD